MGHVHGLLGVLVSAWIGRTLVEGHNDICTNLALDVHNSFRSEQVFCAVNVRGKRRTFLSDLALVGKTVDLITAAVGENRSIPTVEFM